MCSSVSESRLQRSASGSGKIAKACTREPLRVPEVDVNHRVPRAASSGREGLAGKQWAALNTGGALQAEAGVPRRILREHPGVYSAIKAAASQPAQAGLKPQPADSVH